MQRGTTYGPDVRCAGRTNAEGACARSRRLLSSFHSSNRMKRTTGRSRNWFPSRKKTFPATITRSHSSKSAGPHEVPANSRTRRPEAIAGAGRPEVMFHLLADVSLPVFSPPGPELVAYHRPEHPAARQFRRLADGIAGQFSSDRSPVLLFTAVSGHSAGGRSRTWRSRERPMELAASS